ncbi:MAG: hypothetical protein ACP5KA_00050 [Desulfurococcaceae archaeon]
MSSLREKAVEVVKHMLSRAYEERQGAYTLVVGELKDARVVICVSDSYAKVVLESDVAVLDCEEIEYQPHGLYAFADNYAELARKAIEKAELLIRRGKKSVE